MTGKSEWIDLGTDARTMPSERMRTEMAAFCRGPDAERDRRLTRELLDRAANLTGKPSALLLPSCTMANLIAIMCSSNRGDQLIAEADSHIAWSEGWGFAAIAGTHLHRIQGNRGRISREALAAACIDERFAHRPPTSLLCLENTHNASGGAVLSVQYTQDICDAARELNLHIHLDGARLFHAAAALHVPLDDLTGPVDSVALNLNKALGAPIGTVLCGSESFIQTARRIAAALGGRSLHKSGWVSAMGLIALEDWETRLTEDHRRARLFAEALQGVPGVQVEPGMVETNIVMADFSKAGISGAQMISRLYDRKIGAYPFRDEVLRFTFHHHISDEQVYDTVDHIAEIIAMSNMSLDKKTAD